MADYALMTVVQLKVEIDKKGLDKSGTKADLINRLVAYDVAVSETKKPEVVPEIILKVEDLDPDEKMLSESEPEDTGPWFEFIRWPEDGSDELAERLGKLNLVVANALVYKDYSQDRDFKTATLDPVTMRDVSMPGLSPMVELCIRFNIHLEPTPDSPAKGYCKLFFKKRLDLEKNIPRLRALTPNIDIHYLDEETALSRAKTVGSNEFFKIKASAEDACTALRKDALTLVTSSVTDTTTEDDLWQIFPEAYYILLSKHPFCHAYIQFESEEKMMAKIESLVVQAPSPQLPRLKVMILSESRKGFAVHHAKNIRKKKRAVNAQQGKGPQQPRAAAPNASQEQRPQANTSGSQQGTTLVEPATAAGSAGAAPGARNPAVVTVFDTEGQPISKSKMRRLKAQRKKAMAREQEAGEAPPNPPPQNPALAKNRSPGPNQPRPQDQVAPRGQQQHLGAGINLLLQTLGSLAQGMSGQNTPMNAQLEQGLQSLSHLSLQSGAQPQGQPPAPGAGKKKRNKKRKNAAGAGGEVPLTGGNAPLPKPPQPQPERGTLQSPTPSGGDQPSAAKRKRWNKKKKQQQANQAGQGGDVFSTENYTQDDKTDGNAFYFDTTGSSGSYGGPGPYGGQGYGATSFDATSGSLFSDNSAATNNQSQRLLNMAGSNNSNYNAY